MRFPRDFTFLSVINRIKINGEHKALWLAALAEAEQTIAGVEQLETQVFVHFTWLSSQKPRKMEFYDGKEINIFKLVSRTFLDTWVYLPSKKQDSAVQRDLPKIWSLLREMDFKACDFALNFHKQSRFPTS